MAASTEARTTAVLLFTAAAAGFATAPAAASDSGGSALASVQDSNADFVVQVGEDTDVGAGSGTQTRFESTAVSDQPTAEALQQLRRLAFQPHRCERWNQPK